MVTLIMRLKFKSLDTLINIYRKNKKGYKKYLS